MNYHIEIWGKGSYKQTNEINKILIETAKALNYNHNGKTDQWYLLELKWLNHNERYEMAIAKLAHKLLKDKNDNSNYLADYMKKIEVLKQLMKTK